ncbi:MAG: KPN_02809 family neutral zinc metallopeptidase [Propionibacteriaceae bacterium]
MEYRDNVQLDSSQVQPAGGGSRSGVAIGGGIGGLIIALIALFLGIDPALLNGLNKGTTSNNQPVAGAEQCKTGASIAENRECRFVAYTNSVQSYWKTQLRDYRVIATIPFTGAISTACGQASSEVGPFYCPGDEKVYLDYGFFDELTGRFGAMGGDAAEAYVIAHEYGHHISNQIGTMAAAQQDQSTGPTSGAVRLELQADCFAGAWLRNATKDPQSPIASITQDDVNRAADAARAVGDDRIQKQATGRVNRESWTHGSANMRQKWLAIGFKSGDPNQCNTFDPNISLG